MKMKRLLGAIIAAALATSFAPTFSQAEVTYEEQDSNSNMAESFTGSAKVVYGQTPSFTVKIPKSIDLDGEGAGKYTVGVKGKIPSKYTVSVIPDETITMVEENNLLDSITADVTAEKTTWAADELNEDSYAESTNNTIQMQSIDFAKFKGTLNFNVSAAIPKVELKDASDEVKAKNKFIGVGTVDIASMYGVINSPEGKTMIAGGIVYTDGGYVSTGPAYSPNSGTIKKGYYKVPASASGTATYLSVITLSYGGNAATDFPGVIYLGESYQVPEV